MKAAALARILRDPGLRRGLAFAVLRQHVHDPHFVQFRGRQDLAGQNQFLRRARTHAARKQAVCAHAGKQVEEDLRQAHHRGLLRDDHVGGKRGLEAAAQRIALHQRNRGQRGAEIVLHAGMDVVDAQPGVMHQRVAVARPDQQQEQRQIAAQVVHPGHARTGHVVVHLVHGTLEFNVAAVCGQFAAEGAQVLEQSQVEAGVAPLVHVAPDCLGCGLVLELHFRVGPAYAAQAGCVAKIAHDHPPKKFSLAGELLLSAPGPSPAPPGAIRRPMPAPCKRGLLFSSA